MNQGEEMELREYLAIIKKRLPLILIITFVSTIIAFIVSFFFMDPVYEAVTTIYAGRQVDAQDQLAYQDAILGQALVKDYREIAKSKTVCRKVKEELAEQENENGNGNMQKILQLTDEELSERITVTLKGDTRIIEIKVSGKDPEVCAIITNKVASVFKEKAAELMRIENIQIIDKADIPTVPVKPNKKLNIAIAFAVGLMASLGIVFLIEYMDNTIETPEDVTKHSGLTVIGIIPVIGVQKEE